MAVRENLVTHPRPRTELGPWSKTGGGTLAPVDAPGPDGVDGFARLTGDGTTAYTYVSVAGPFAAQTIYGSMWVRSSVSIPVLMQLGTSTSQTDLEPGEWTELSFSYFHPGSISTVSLLIAPYDGSAVVPLPAGETFDTTMAYVSLTEGSYFDGSFSDTEPDLNGYQTLYSWTGPAWASTSTEVTDARAGVLTAQYDPTWAAVRLVVDGGMWPAPVSQIRIERQAAGEASIPVRGIEELWVTGGYYVGTDHEMPLNTTVSYTVHGYNQHGELVAQSTATVGTVGSTDCDLWIKAPGQPDLSQNVIFRGIGNVGSATRGGAYQIHQSDPDEPPRAIAQWSGADTNTFGILIGVKTPSGARALETLFRQARVLLIQHAGPDPEFEPTWYLLHSWSRVNPSQQTYQLYAKRNYELRLTATTVPAGFGVQSSGTTWGGVMAQYDTWQDVMDDNPTWFDVLLGG